MLTFYLFQVNTLTSTKVTVSDCVAKVEFTGPAGCATYDITQELEWLSEHPIILGVVYFITGVFVGFFGLSMFPYVAATIASFFSMFFVILLSATFGGMDTPTGSWISLGVMLVVGILTGCLVRRNIWVTLGLLGAVGGFFAGVLLLDVVSAISGWTATWALWVFGIVGVIAGFFAVFKMGSGAINLTTSFIGSYLMVRATTLWFGPEYWPSESAILSGEFDASLGWQFYLFLAILVILTWGTVKFQANQKRHKELDDNFERA